MRISIFGLGYVGSVIAACMADQSHHVICYDIDREKLDRIDNKESPIVEPELLSLIEKGVTSGRLSTATNPNQAIDESDVTFICVGTPSAKDGSLDLQYMLSACETISDALRDKPSHHTVIIRSTILPGTSENYLIPCLEEFSGKKAGRDFSYLLNPEFLREGSAVADYRDPPKIVIGVHPGSDPSPLETLYAGFDCPKITTSLKNAEAIKYVDNSWHALKVGFANEMGNILKDHGIDSHDVMDIFALDTKLNISNAYLKPGFSYGGSCLPKDVKALAVQARSKGLGTPILSSLMQANEDQIVRAADMISTRGIKKILLLGIAFKANTDDLRNSPLLKMAGILLQRNYDLMIYDPNILRREKFPLKDHLVDKIDDALSSADMLIVGNRDESFVDIVGKAPEGCFILDLARLDSRDIRNRKNYAGICW